MDDSCRAHCDRKSYHRRYSWNDPEHLLDNRQPVLSRCASPSLLSEGLLPACRAYSTDLTASLQCSYLMFHWVTGIPFGSELHGGAYDDLTLWEQIDGGAQNTPSKKWLFSVPVVLCVSQHSPSPRTHATTILIQLSTFHTLHELQSMVVRDQSVSTNNCTCAQAAYCAFSVVGC